MAQKCLGQYPLRNNAVGIVCAISHSEVNAFARHAFGGAELGINFRYGAR